LLGCP